MESRAAQHERSVKRGISPVRKKPKPTAKLNPGWKLGRSKRRRALAATMIQKCFRSYLLRRAFREKRVDTRATFMALRAFHRARDRKVWRGVDLRSMSREELRLAALALNLPSTGKKVLLICRLQHWVDQQLLASDLAADAAARAVELHAKGQGAVYVCNASEGALAIDLLPLRGKNVSAVVAGHDSDAVYAVDRTAGTLWLCKTGGTSGQVGLCRNTNIGSRSDNNSVELENPDDFTSPSTSRWLAAPVFVHTLRSQHIVSASVAKAHAVALTAAGEIFTWGDNAHGELGVAATSAASVAKNRATVVASLANYRALAISASGQHTLAICDRVAGCDGVVFAWGSNTFGQLGVGAPSATTITPSFPRPLVLHQVNTLRSLRVRQVACGLSHSLALTDEGHIYSWGCTDGGRLGLSDHSKGGKQQPGGISQQVQATPTRITGCLEPLAVLSVACGAWHSACIAAAPEDAAYFGAGRIFTWGTGIYGQLGHGEQKVLNEPRIVPLLRADECFHTNNNFDEKEQGELVSMVACGTYHTAAVTTSNRVVSWGSHRIFAPKPRAIRLQAAGRGNNRHDGSDEVFGKIASLACGRTFTIFNTERRTSDSFEPPPSPSRINGALRRKKIPTSSIPRLNLSVIPPVSLTSSLPTPTRAFRQGDDSIDLHRLEPKQDQLQRHKDEKERLERIEAIDIESIIHPLCRVCWACDGFQPSPLRLWTCRRCCHDKNLHGTRKPGAPLGEFEAARKLQTLYRARKARQFMQRAREKHYQRVFSIRHNDFFYYNLWKRETSWQRPAALSGIVDEDDIPVRDPDEIPTVEPPLTKDEAATLLQAHYRGWKARVLVQGILSRMYEKHVDLSKGDSDVALYYIKTHEADGRLCAAPIAARRWDIPPPLLRRRYSLGEPVEILRRRERANWSFDDAARALQRQFRRFRARKLVLKMAQSRYRKVLDENSGQFYYYNVVTKESSWQTPRMLKSLEPSKEEPNNINTTNKGKSALGSPFRKQRIRREKFADEESAATTIQALYRRFASRKLALDQAHRRYSKMTDPDTGKNYYYDRVLGASTWIKPAILGSTDLAISSPNGSSIVTTSHTSDKKPAPPSPTRRSVATYNAVSFVSDRARQKRHKRRLQRLRQMTPDQAAGLLQRAWRSNRARRELRSLLFEAYEKIYDPVTENYYYYNTKTGVVRWEKPMVLLPDGEDDIKERVGGGKRHRRKRKRTTAITDQTEAAIIVRTFVRCGHARLQLHKQLRARIQKLWDAGTQRYYYFDVLTGQSSWKKPVVLGDFDLPCVNQPS